MPKKISIWIAYAAALALPGIALADELTDALTGGKASGNFRLRFEDVNVDSSTLKDATALTLRSRLGYETASYYGFTALLEFQDTHVVDGRDKYTPEFTDSTKPANNPYDYAAIVDPERTDVDQAYLRYRGEQKLDLALGRQLILLDNQRFVGPSAWRQNQQTFDAFTAKYDGAPEWSFYYAYINKVNGIADVQPTYNYDIDSSDNLFNLSYSGFAFGKFTAYGYYLNNQQPYGELINAGNSNDLNPSLRYKSNDTYGLRFDGSYSLPSTPPLRLLYTAEYAKQTQETLQSGSGAKTKFDMDYSFVEAGAGYAAKSVLVSAKIAQEELGSGKDHVGATTVMQGFQTPYATKHIFNGWVDMFLNTPAGGLKDRYATLSADLQPYGVKLMAMYHKYSEVDGPATGGGARTFGDELNLQALKQFGTHYTLGVKYGKYIADKDVATIIGTTANVDTSKFWVWGEFTF